MFYFQFLQQIMNILTKIIQYKVALFSLKHNYNRNRNILIHHGLMGSSKNFRNLSKAPAFSNYVNSHLIDARNHGDSPHTLTHSPTDLADDLYEYIKTNNLLDPSKRLTLMGHSMGGMALMQFTKRYDSPQIQSLIDRVVIIDIPASSIINRDSYAKTGNMLKKMNEIDMNQPIAQIHKDIENRATTKDIAALIKTSVIQSENNTYKWKVNLNLLANQGYRDIGNFDLSKDNPGKWKVPVQIIYGQFSGYFDQQQYQIYKQFYPQISEQQCHKIDRAGHWVHFENAQLFLEKVQLILKKDEPKIKS